MKHRYWIIALSVIALDQLTKLLASLYLRTPFVVLPFFRLAYSENTGAGFSILQGMNTMLIFVMLIIIGLLLYFFKSFKKEEKLFISMIIGGAVGNLISRILLGHVIDFIDFRIWPVFNIADSAITAGVIGLLYLMFRK